MYPIYDDYARQGHVEPTGPFPSYFTWPDGGYSEPNVHGGFDLQPDYFSRPPGTGSGAPAGETFQGGGWYQGQQPYFQGGDAGASGSGAAATPEGSDVYVDLDDFDE
ncbi:hypothetical protein RND81_03G216100 [Saponaria officinalis]|uniref:Uncharacterized protein n=1 Tax=Saponaria officinalis TaxID=3572 RepID=A0AAW1M6C6_SAPOF